MTVDGDEPVPFIVRGSDPIIDLALRHRPYFEDGTLTGLQPRDRFTIWVVMDPDEPMPAGKRDVTFTDTASGRPVLKIAAGVAGISAGLAPYLPTVVCPGVGCTSCFACFGAGGAAASALIVGLVSRRLRNSARDRNSLSPTVTVPRRSAPKP